MQLQAVIFGAVAPQVAVPTRPAARAVLGAADDVATRYIRCYRRSLFE